MMHLSNRRRAGLVAGVSMTVLCATMPVAAQSVPGIEQIVTGAAPAGNVLVGEIVVPAGVVQAFGTTVEGGSSVSARVESAINANPGAINQSVTASSGDAVAAISHDGDTSISAIAIGSAVGEDAGSATVNSRVEFGVNQFAQSDDNASVLFTQTDPAAALSVFSGAYVEASSLASATAGVDVGIGQFGIGELVALDISNAGTLEFGAEASAQGGTGAAADARVIRSLYQEISSQPAAVLDVSNAAGGVIRSTADAEALTDSGSANAFTENRVTVFQLVNGGGFMGEDAGPTADLSLSNAGVISGTATSNAVSGGEDAITNATLSAVTQQQVQDLETSSLSLVNAAGASITGGAFADAESLDRNAFANTVSYYAALQESYRGSTFSGLSHEALLTNAGTLSVSAEANALSGANYAQAFSYAGYGIAQYSYYSDEILNSVTNLAGGIIGVSSAASATSEGGAYAYSDAYASIDQYAEGRYGWDFQAASIVNTVDNAGTLQRSSTAIAGGEDNVNAYAYSDTAVRQTAYYAADISNTASNAATGVLNAASTATATSENVAYAYANSGGGIAQYGNGEIGSGALGDSIANSVQNAGRIQLAGSATAEGINFAYAQTRGNTAVRQQGYYAAEISNSVTNAATGILNVSTQSSSVSEAGYAQAEAYGEDTIRQVGRGSYSHGGGEDVAASVSNTVTNAGTITQTNSAAAFGETDAYTYVTSGSAVYQTGEDAIAITNSLVNSAGGTISVGLTSTANAMDGFAGAYSDSDEVIRQFASNYSYSYGEDAVGATASLSLQNNGLISSVQSASATSANGGAEADSEMDRGIYQYAEGNFALQTLTITNGATGRINFTAASQAEATNGTAQSNAEIDTGIRQNGSAFNDNTDAPATVNVLLSNAAGGTINLAANAQSVATGGNAQARAEVEEGIDQIASSDQSTVTLTNAGTITMSAISNATSLPGADEDDHGGSMMMMGEDHGPLVAEAFSEIDRGIMQEAFGSSVSLSNTGTITFAAQAAATSPDEAWSAAFAEGIRQVASGEDGASASFTNAATRTVSVSATSEATGAFAASNAGALGLSQSVETFSGWTLFSTENGAEPAPVATASFTNAGTFSVSATADADGSEFGVAYASAGGYQVSGFPLAATISNSGTFNVSATATSTGFAGAEALGMLVGSGFFGEGIGGPGGPGGPILLASSEPSGGMSATITNSGTMAVTATALGGDATGSDDIMTLGSPWPVARAGGIVVDGLLDDLTITNSGTIRVTAISNGNPVETGGIVVFGGGFLSPLVMDEEDEPLPPTRLTIANNGGTIIARESTNGGANFVHGTAIDTSDSFAPVDINFTGNSRVYGNIFLAEDDAITIVSGTTRLDGVVNPFVPAGEDSFAILSTMSSAPLVGSLTINTGATLLLEDNPHNNTSYSGPAAVNVETFTMQSGSTLTLQLPTSTSAAVAQASYPQVTATTANLAGTLRVQVNTPNGLYGNSYLFEDIISADTRNGQFASVVTSTGSVLLTPTVSYDANSNVDLRINRVGFGALSGLTVNQRAAGNAIEQVYSPTQGGAFGTTLANLFLINNANTYADALNQLSGSQYAGHIQALRNSSVQVNTLVSDQIDCAVTRGGIEACRKQDDGVRLWAVVGYNDARMDTDGNGIGYNNDNMHALLGVDYTVSNFTIGAFGGYRKVNSKFDLYGGEVRTDGYQIGMVAGYDAGDFYVRANGSYSEMNGNSTRTVNILSTAGTITAEPDFRLASVYAEAGGRIAVGKSWLTPFVGLEHTNVKMKGFNEAGVAGANLGFADQSRSETSVLAGLKWAGRLGNVIPEAKLAYRHDGAAMFLTDQRFINAPGAATFTTFSPRANDDSVMAGFSLAALFNDKITGRVGYQGRFASGLRDNAFYGNLVIRFGGTK